MGKNTIYYGSPGTGKTFILQKIAQDYTGFTISNEEIVDAYISSSLDWVLIALILLQNNNLMTSDEIATKIVELRVSGMSETPSSILERHSVSLDTELFMAEQPQIFRLNNGEWSVVLNRLLEYDGDFYRRYLSSEGVEERYEFCTFHQSFVYEDFVEGIRPIVTKNQSQNAIDGENNQGRIGYEIQDGIFKRLCIRASNNPHKEYAIFIDEINRGNISEIFGELISLIEPDKRLGASNELKVKLPYSKEIFGVPSNVNIYGSMNSADRSITIMDIALRRRFEFVNMTYDSNIISETLLSDGIDPEDIDGINIISMLETINKRIELLLDANFIIGHAYFTKVRSYEDIKNVLIKKVVPLLEEYFYDDLQKIQLIFADLDDVGELKENAIYCHEILDPSDLLEYSGEYNFEQKKRFFVNESIDLSSIRKIYLRED